MVRHRVIISLTFAMLSSGVPPVFADDREDVIILLRNSEITPEAKLGVLTSFSTDIVPTLIDLLISELGHEGLVIRALGQLKDNRASIPLVESLTHANREVTLQALRSIGGRQGADHLHAKMMSKSDSVSDRIFAARNLFQIGDSPAKEEAEAFLTNEDLLRQIHNETKQEPWSQFPRVSYWIASAELNTTATHTVLARWVRTFTHKSEAFILQDIVANLETPSAHVIAALIDQANDSALEVDVRIGSVKVLISFKDHVSADAIRNCLDDIKIAAREYTQDIPYLERIKELESEIEL